MTDRFMIFIAPFVLFLSIFWSWDFTPALKPLSEMLHERCVQEFYHEKNKNDLSRSFICGEKVTLKNQKTLLQKSGVYHAIVVSGGHFLFLEAVLKRMHLPLAIRMTVLFLYYLVTGLQAPGLRCLVQMNLGLATEKLNLKPNSPTLCFYSGLVCLMISAPLWNSLSFWLSFVVSLALCFSRELTQSKSKELQFLLPLVCIYIFLIPFNFTSGYLHPLNLILGAILIYPFCSLLLFSALLTITGKLTNTDFLFQINTTLSTHVFTAIEKATQLIPNKNQEKPNLFIFWLYAFILITTIHLIAKKHQRETIHE
jgi:ComEC/Rec2-related protein